MPTFPVHFLSGLPRSGSTLLAAILRQHPQIAHAGHSSPVAPMIQKLASVMAEGEFQSEFDALTQRRVLQGVLQSYYNHQDQTRTIIDNNRLWCTRLGLIDALFPEARIICCVRDPVWVVDSFERLLQKDPLLSSKIIPIQKRATLYDRVDHLLSPEGPFGYAWRALNEAYFSTLAGKLILLDYDALTTHPQRSLAHLERALNLPPHRYDLNTITAAPATDFDHGLNTPGLHTVRPKLATQHRRPILPPDIVQRLAGSTFWRDSKMNPANVTIIA